VSGQRTVRIAEGRVVYVDGVARHAGELVELSAADARTLVTGGDAAESDAPAKKPRVRKSKATPPT
jgi:hypothetical protein